MNKSKLLRRLLSVLLAVVMLMSVIPFSMTAVAATSEHPDAVTITVVDQNGNAVQGASVYITVDSASNGYGYISETKTTDEYGTVDVIDSNVFVDGDLSLSASVSKTGYSVGNINSEDITSADQDFSIKLTATSITDVAVTATNEVYTGSSYPAAIVTGAQQGDTVSYKLNDSEYQKDMPTIKEPGTYSLTVRIERNGYDVFEQTVQSVVSLNKIILSVKEYKGFYDSKEHDALTVEGLLDTDEVAYTLNGSEPTEDIPKVSDVGSYTLTINVKRYGYQDYSGIFNGVSIEAIDISGYSVSAYQGVYDGLAHDAVYVECDNPEDGDKVEYMLGESGTWTEEVPQISAAGSYDISVRITRAGNNYKPTVLTAIAYIDRATQTLKFKNDSYYDGGSSNIALDTAHAANNVYDFSAIDASTQISDGISYFVSNVSDESDVSTIASITADGQLTVKAPGCISLTATKAGGGNYADASIVYTLIITESAEQLVSFNISSTNYVFGENSGNISNLVASKKYADDNGGLTYSINKKDIGISCNSENGALTISDYELLSSTLEDGPIQLVVSVEKAVGTKTVQVQTKPEKPENAMTIYFSDAANWGSACIHYWGGSKESSFPGESMTYVETNGYGQKVYKYDIPDDTKGILFSNGSDANQTVDITSGFGHNVGYYTYYKDFDGKWQVGSYNRSDDYSVVEQQKPVYESSSASYIINISTALTPDNPYVLSGNTNNGWHISDVTVTPTEAESYTISTKPVPEKFGADVIISNQGSGARYVYLRTASGAITNKIELEGLKIDTIAPDPGTMSIEYSETNSFLELLSRIFKFYEPSATITFIVDDETGDDESGLSQINWYYTKDNDATSTILASESGTLVPYLKDGKYVADLELTASLLKQYRGNISFNATDIAGNTPDGVYNGKEVIVIDTINPVFKAEHKMVDPEDGFYKQDGDTHQYTGDVDFTFTINEANFFKEHATVSVSVDGGKAEPVEVEWTSEDETHIGTLTLSGDGDYVVYLKYEDGSGNKKQNEQGFTYFEDYESDTIIIDNTAASIDEVVENQTISFTIFERNFKPENFIVTGTIEDINGNATTLTVEVLTSILNDQDNWKKVSGKKNTYEFTYDFKNSSSYYEGIYDIEIGYADNSGGNSVKLQPDTFVIDHTSPNNIDIEYSTSLEETILEILTLGFYNPSVTMTFTAYDTYAGVDHFTWNYTKQNGASDINVAVIEDTNIVAVQDAEDKSKFTAEITLTADEYKQFRGHIAVGATDKNDNVSNKITDTNKVVIVDTIAPEMTVEYSQESRYYNSKYYYNGDITAIFKITEANFFEQDVKAIVSKNGAETALDVEKGIEWYHLNSDEHIGKLILTDDGDYIIKVEYTDRSGNKMDSYESDVRVIDTIDPIIDVSYANKTPINTLKDSDNNDREYFDNTQTATIKITEKNFEKNEVDFSSIVSKDVTGLELGNDSIRYSEWSDAGDEHVIVITYNGDANYAFDIDYTDLATNAAADYETDYFTVDRTAPENLTITYSPSVLDTIIESLSFGFYRAKAKVTITADDSTSPINEFVYSYTKASGVSKVNAELLNQAVSEAKITYSNGNKTATATFEIPKSALTNRTQFNGTVGFSAKDRAGNDTDKKDKKRMVVDNIAPTCEVTYNAHVNQANNIYYYDGNINATITINEANFYSNDVVVSVTKDGASYPVNVNWKDQNVDVHTGTFTLGADGDYVVSVTYTDKSGNTMNAYKSNQLTIDTQINKPTFSINGVAKTDNGGSYKKDATISFAFEDENYNTNSVKLERTVFGKTEDVTSKFVNVSKNANGGSARFSIPKAVANDGIYTLTVGMTDMANHTTSSTLKFTINRFGSVYEYSEYLSELILDGGQYVTSITEDLVITEYNPDKILKDSLNIMITRDGEAIDVDYTSNPAQINSKASISSSGWYQYVYTIKASNFEQDGVYKISVTSAYAATDSAKNESTSVPENSLDKEGKQILDSMNFVVDSKAPEIRNIVNLEEAIVNAQSLTVKYTIVDVGGLKSIEVIVNGEVLDTITEFGDDVFNYSGQFTINEQSGAQAVQFRVTDLAGNVTDTATEDFSTGDLYVFNDTITVSTNFFVRWYANKLLFWGSIGGVIVLAAIIWFIIAKRKKNEE